MAETGGEILPTDSEPHQDPAGTANRRSLSAPTATPLEQPSNDTADSLRSAEEGLGVKGKWLGVNFYSTVDAHIVLPRSRNEDMCPSSQSRTRALRLHVLFDEVYVSLLST